MAATVNDLGLLEEFTASILTASLPDSRRLALLEENCEVKIPAREALRIIDEKGWEAFAQEAQEEQLNLLREKLQTARDHFVRALELFDDPDQIRLIKREI